MLLLILPFSFFIRGNGLVVCLPSFAVNVFDLSVFTHDAFSEAQNSTVIFIEQSFIAVAHILDLRDLLSSFRPLKASCIFRPRGFILFVTVLRKRWANDLVILTERMFVCYARLLIGLQRSSTEMSIRKVHAFDRILIIHTCFLPRRV